MKTTNKITVFIVFALISVFSYAGDEVGFEITADYFGKYIWRGQNITDDPVFQPGISIDWKGFTVGLWANMDTTNVNDNSGEFTEYNWWLDYSADTFVEGVGFSAGVIYYYFPSEGDTTEIYWGLNFDLPLNPSFVFYHDVDDIDGTYASVAVNHSIEKVAELTPDIPVGLEFCASLGWGSRSYNNGYWDVRSPKLNDLTLSLDFPVDISGWIVRPNLTYVTLVNRSIRRANENDSDYFFAGIGISKSF